MHKNGKNTLFCSILTLESRAHSWYGSYGRVHVTAAMPDLLVDGHKDNITYYSKFSLSWNQKLI